MSDLTPEDLPPKLRLADIERKRKFRELLSLTSRAPRERQDLILFGGIMSRALAAIHAFVVHRELLSETAQNTWWHRAWEDAVQEWSKALK